MRSHGCDPSSSDRLTPIHRPSSAPMPVSTLTRTRMRTFTPLRRAPIDVPRPSHRSVVRTDGTPARASRALNARSRIERMPDPTGPDHPRSRASTPVTIGLGRSTRQRNASANRTAQRGQSDPGAKAARVKGRPRAGAPGPRATAIGLVNMSDAPAQARVRLPRADLAEGTWKLTERLTERHFRRAGDERVGAGLYVALDPWASNFLALAP
jgi:hypothetical protein